MARVTNIQRLDRLKRALKKAKKGNKLTHAELAQLCQLSKGAFSNLKAKCANFPASEQGPRNTVLYEAKDALESLIAYESLAEDDEVKRQKMAAEIIGAAQTSEGEDGEQVFLPPSEMLKLSRLRAEIEERERAQGEHVPIAAVKNLATRIYGRVKGPLDQLDVRVDANGLLSAEQRALIAELGRDALLGIARDIEEELGIDVDHELAGVERAARKARRPKRKPTSRKRK